MSREIKFRAFNKGTGKMIDLYKVTPLALDATLNCDGLFIPFREGYELMQYTGLKDIEGTEIYEGDLISYTPGDNREVIFMSGAFGILNIERNGRSFGSYRTWREGIVIGNIYENPELNQQP